MIRIAVLCLTLPLGLLPSPAQGCGDSSRVRYEPRTFLGYACEDGCERHKAGFRWAEQRAVTGSGQCMVLPRPNAEGCAAYVDEGRDAEAAGDRWAIENEIAHQDDCEGAGERFFAGCVRQLLKPINTY
jgi:hypothetical protein